MMVNNTYGNVDEKYTTYNYGNLSGWEEYFNDISETLVRKCFHIKIITDGRAFA